MGKALKNTGLVILWWALTIGTMVAAAYLWVWIYSVTIETGGDQAFYEAYAQVASPVVAVVTAFPVFYFMGWFFRRYDNAAALAIGVVVAHWVMEVLVIAGIGADAVSWHSFVSAILKLAGAYLGLRPALSSAAAH